MIGASIQEDVHDVHGCTKGVS
jgi:hypothetical protein